MALSTSAKHLANSILAPLRLRLESRTEEQLELDRLEQLSRTGHFETPVFPVLPQFEECDCTPVLDQIAALADRFARFDRPDPNGFSLQNNYYSTPDAEVLYAMVNLFRPRQIIETGSGNSTRLFRAAVNDAGIDGRILSIDPNPRVEISAFSDEVVRARAESVDRTVFTRLQANDILFIDSSHEIRAGNDVVFLLLDILPRLEKGVVVHIHDIFLPYEYPRRWVIEERWQWTEQYLVQALLTGNNSFAVLWPGYYLQKTLPDFSARFRHWRTTSMAGSLWLQRR